MFVLKLILRTRGKQFRQLCQKNFEQRPINLRSMSKNDARKKFLTKKIFTINWCNWETESSTDNPTNKSLSNWQKNSLNAQWWNEKKIFFSKKNSSTDLLGHNVSSFDNAADCCPKKSLDFFAQGLQMINETNKYFSKRFYVFKLTPWTRRMQCRQLGRKKFRTKTEIFAIYVQKLWEKKFLTKISPPQTGLIDKQ